MTLLVDSGTTHPVNTPVERIDLSQWLFALTNEAYRSCSTAHIAGGASRTEDGRRMSINVERISGNLIVQRYVEELAEPHHVRVKSISDSFSAAGDTTLEVMWELRVKPLDDTRSEFSNRVVINATPAFLESMAKSGVPLSAVKTQMAANTDAHNREETPLFARDIQTKALIGVW